jgi:hypothetical protein
VNVIGEMAGVVPLMRPSRDAEAKNKAAV